MFPRFEDDLEYIGFVEASFLLQKYSFDALLRVRNTCVGMDISALDDHDTRELSSLPLDGKLRHTLPSFQQVLNGLTAVKNFIDDMQAKKLERHKTLGKR